MNGETSDRTLSHPAVPTRVNSTGLIAAAAGQPGNSEMRSWKLLCVNILGARNIRAWGIALAKTWRHGRCPETAAALQICHLLVSRTVYTGT